MTIAKMIHRALSDSDLRRILGRDMKIIKYSELSKFNELNELLPNEKDCCVILYEDALNHGHWIALSKYKGIFEFFDSYGISPDGELHWLNMKKRQTLNEATPYLSNLLDSQKYIYNHVRYQQSDLGVNTCGSHVAFRIFQLMNDNTDLQNYEAFMKSKRKLTGMTYDEIVANFVNKFF